jgi:Rieske Fe-S protein
MILRRKITLLIAVLLTGSSFLVSGCKKEKNEYDIPDVYVDVYIYTSDPRYSSLNAVGGWAYVSAGYKGIIVYRNGPDTFSAFERACTFDPNKPCEIVSVEPNGLTGKDDCCGSRFQIIDGTVLEGPAFRPLKRYNTFWDGNALRIYN